MLLSVLTPAALCHVFLLVSAPAQTINDRIISQHVRLRVPMEREYLARDVVSELENCWVVINRATGERLPRKILVDIKWDDSDSRVEFAESRIVIGMDHPAAPVNMREFVLRNAAREIGRLGLLSLSRTGAIREESEFLVEGMAEILAREYFRSTRSFAGAWILAQFLDRMNLLGLKAQSSWTAYSGGRHDLRAAAPGITFLLTCRELYGRDKMLRLFEHLTRGSLEESVAAVFKANVAVLESTWLQKVREFRVTEDITAGSDEEAPRLEQIIISPEVVRAGITLMLRLYVRRGTHALLSEGLYVRDEAAGRVFQARTPAEKDAKYALVEMPIESGRQPGNYSFMMVALDEGGNVRSWSGNYTVQR